MQLCIHRQKRDKDSIASCTPLVNSRSSNVFMGNDVAAGRKVRQYLCPQERWSCSVPARLRSSCSLSWGVKDSPKSSALKIGRISIADSPGIGLGQRLTQAMASSIDCTCQIQNPAISSFVSVNGPSITLRFVPENLTRAPFELGCSPSAASRIPALTNSSLYCPISVRSCSLGMTPASESWVALTRTMTFIVKSPFVYVC